MLQVVAALAGAIATFALQELSRWLSGSVRTEALDRRLRVLALHRRLKQAEIGLEELDRIECELTGGGSEGGD